jgi:hypothetical protein
MLKRRHAQGAAGQDDVWRERDQFRRVSAIAVDIVLAPPNVELHIAAVAPAQLLQDVLERRDLCLIFRIVRGAFMSTAMRRIGSGCCARAASGKKSAATAALPNSVMKSRRLIRSPRRRGQLPL